jgi:hypothetical protein
MNGVERRDNSADRRVKIRPLDHIDGQEEEREGYPSFACPSFRGHMCLLTCEGHRDFR